MRNITLLGKFFLAAGYIGGGSVVISLLLFGIAIREHLVGANVTAFSFLCAAPLAFGAGAFLAWLEEHETVACLEIQLADLSAPNLAAEINGVMFADAKPGEAFLTLMLSVSNKGADSFVSLQGVEVRLYTGEVPAAKRFISPVGSIALKGSPGEPNIVLDPRDSFLGLIANQSIRRGSKVSGWACFVCRKLSPAEQSHSGTSVAALFTDMNHRPITASVSISGDPWSQTYNPAETA